MLWCRGSDQALHHATQAGHQSVVRILLKYNHDIHARTATGKTPLQVRTDGRTA